MDANELLKLDTPPAEAGKTLDSDFKHLDAFIQSFNTKAESLLLLPGLDEPQKDTLRTYSAELKKIKEKMAQDPSDLDTTKALISNERKATPATKRLYWWQKQLGQLNQADFWEQMAANIKTTGHNKKESDEIINRRLNQLQDIRTDWDETSCFAGFSSTELYDFYTNYISIIKKTVTKLIKAKKKLKPPVQAYLSTLNTKVIALEKSAINAMIKRLYCSEYLNDIGNDDLISLTFERIKSECRIQLPALERVQDQRYGLAAEKQTEFNDCISNYLNLTKEDQASAAAYQKLKQNKLPIEWKKIAESKAIESKLAVDPIVLYFIHFFPALLDEACISHGIEYAILKTDCANSTHFTLNRIARLLDSVDERHLNLTKKAPHELKNDISGFIHHSHSEFAQLLNEINTKIEVKIHKNIQILLNKIFSNDNTTINDSLTTQVIKEIERAEKFNMAYLKNNYCPYTDLVTELALKIRSLIAQDIYFTPTHVARVLDLLQRINPPTSRQQAIKLQQNMHYLLAHSRTLKDMPAGDLQRFLIHEIEKSSIDANNLQTSLARHKHIAAQHNEYWIPLENSEASYIANVLMPICKSSHYINIANFHDQPVLALIKKINPNQDTKQLEGEFKAIVFNKVNDIFQIKDFLYNEAAHKIDINKLKTLLEKIDTFFTDKKQNTLIRQSITSACISLLKNYCLAYIRNDEAPDVPYIKQVNDLLGGNVFHLLCQEEDITNMLKSYITAYGGMKSTLSALLPELAPADQDCECTPFIVKYANKRLESIPLTGLVTAEDVRFFSYFNANKEIHRLFQECKDECEDLIIGVERDKNEPWDRQIASVIELFANDPDLIIYRSKRLSELVMENASEESMSQFLSTINSSRLFDSRILPKNSFIQNSRLSTFLSKLKEDLNWPWIKYKILMLLGDQELLQQYRFAQMTDCLNRLTNFQDNWLGKLLTSTNTDGWFASQDQAAILDKIQNLLKEVDELNNTLTANKKLLDRASLEKAQSIIHCLLPLTSFYINFGTDIPSQRLCLELPDILQKFKLHYELNAVIPNVANNNLVIHNGILSLVISIKNLEKESVLTYKNINHFLNVIHEHALSDIFNQLNQPRVEIDAASLATLYNLLSSLSSDHIKMLLIEANKPDIDKNPYWLTLINHLDDEKALENINDLLSQNDDLYNRSDDFNTIFSFANRLTALKLKTKQALKTHLFQQAGIAIPVNPSDKLATIIQSDQINKKQLLKLWSAAMDLIPNTPYSALTIKLIGAISNEILTRSIDEPGLLKTFCKQFQHSTALNEIDHSPSQKRPFSLWFDATHASHTIRPLQDLLYKSCLMQLTWEMAKQGQAMLGKKRKVLFNLFCRELNPDTLNISKTKERLMLTHMLQLRKSIQLTLSQPLPTQQIAEKIHQLIQNPALPDLLAHSKRYQHFLHTLEKTFDKSFIQRVNPSIIATTTSKAAGYKLDQGEMSHV